MGTRTREDLEEGQEGPDDVQRRATKYGKGSYVSGAHHEEVEGRRKVENVGKGEPRGALTAAIRH